MPLRFGSRTRLAAGQCRAPQQAKRFSFMSVCFVSKSLRHCVQQCGHREPWNRTAHNVGKCLFIDIMIWRRGERGG